MLTDVKEGAKLLALAEAAEKHLREQGHDVQIAANDDGNAFDILRAEGNGGAMICRIQGVRDGMWEVVRTNGETLTGLGGETVFITMIERLVSQAENPGRR
ncbi:MAG: hypothetical protein AAF713_07880 [Pseudomonadota bacterium]